MCEVFGVSMEMNPGCRGEFLDCAGPKLGAIMGMDHPTVFAAGT